MSAAITHDFRDMPEFDADDSGAVDHEVIPPTDDEVEAELDSFLSIFTAPQRKQVAR